MAYKCEDKLRKRADRFIKVLRQHNIQGRIVPNSFRDYMVKVSVIRSGHVFGNVNLYYSPKKDRFTLRTYELEDKSIVPDLETCWHYPSSLGASAEVSNRNRYHIYVDGSCFGGPVGYGLVILKDDRVVDELWGTVEDDALQGMHQVGGELQAMYEAIAWCQVHDVERISLFYDYEGIEKWATGKWRAKNTGTRAYAKAAQAWGVEIDWQKVASHSGDRWNDKADELAKRGAQSDTSESCDPLQEAQEKVEVFIDVLNEEGIRASLAGVYNNQYVRIDIAPQGFFDVYNTSGRSLSDPYLHEFNDQSLQRRVKRLWRIFLSGGEEGKKRTSSINDVLEEITYLYKTLKPYRNCQFDFIDLARAIEKACECTRCPISDVGEMRYDFDKLEEIYLNLKEEASEYSQ